MTRFSWREAPYELEVVAEKGSNVSYINPVIVLDRSMGRYAEAVLLMDERGMLSEILLSWTRVWIKRVALWSK